MSSELISKTFLNIAIYFGVIQSYLSSYNESNLVIEKSKLFLMVLNTLKPTAAVIPFIPSSLATAVIFVRVNEK